GLADRGKTVLVSSHILAEVEQVADTVSIVARGRLVAQGTVAELIGRQAGTTVRVGVEVPGTAGDLLAAQGWAVRRDGHHLLVDGAPSGARITEVLARAGLFVDELVPVRVDLESVFLELTAGQGPGTRAPDAPDHQHGRRSAGGAA
ncbi:ABC transporter, partial [Cellulomonas sp. A375-1]